MHALRLPALALCLAMGASAQTPSIPDFSLTPRAQVPDVNKWKIEDLYATNQAWSADFAVVKQEATKAMGLAKGWLQSPKAAADFLEALDAVQKRGTRLAVYASMQSDMDLADPSYQKMKGEASNFFVDLGAQLAFMEADILKLGAEKAEAWFKAEPRLAAYRISFERTLRQKDHILPEAQAKIVALTGLFSDSPSKASGLLNDLDLPRAEVTFSDGAKVMLNTANYAKYRASTIPADRRLAMEAYWINQKKFENTFAALFDGEIKNHLFGAKVRHFDTCLDAALFPNDIKPEVYKNLISTVRANLNPLHRLLKLRQKMLNLPEFRYGDVYASAVASVNRTYTYEQAQALVLDAMKPMGPEYGAALKQGFDGRWVDIYPNVGKASGAYSNGVFGAHPYVKMNFDGRYSEVSTLAHEMGHAMHSWFSDTTQPFPVSQYPIFLAEIASTFNENLLIRHMLKSEKDDRLKLFLLDKYLEGMRGTLYRQTLFADFELAMHERVEAGQSLTPDWLNAKYLELTRLYYGHDKGVTKVEDYISNEWSGIPHFFMNYYVFQYATGIIASTALADAVIKEGAPARDRYLNLFLKAGGTRFPLDTLRAAGVDLSTPKPAEQALKAFDDLVTEMEVLAAKVK
jgi:oligoendopeptidase F